MAKTRVTSSGRSIKLDLMLSASVAFLWVCTGAAISSRTQLVFSYETLVSTPAQYEILAAPNSALIVLFLTATIFPVSVCFWRTETIAAARKGIGLALIASLPLVLVIARCFSDSVPSPHFWEPIWFAMFTGLAAHRIARSAVIPISLSPMFWRFALIAITVLAGAWWYWQSDTYYRNFEIGFNDFGHFTQRIANTAAGRGFLMESPVLPIFWDHFNPGLALLVPAWWLWPDVHLIFAIQAVCLATSALLIASIARKLGSSECCAAIWGVTWLLHPLIGQMNLAYTYGWHPITVAIPMLLLAFRVLLARKFIFAIVIAIFACSFEEGVIVVIACFAAAMTLRDWFRGKNLKEDPFRTVNWKIGLVTFIVASIAFVLVYKLSGLAEFQTARFAKLGNSAFEILLSPMLKPTEFWSLLGRARNLAFVLFLLVPLFIPSIIRNAWCLLAIALPLGVLLVWEHLPAQSIAFQYASCVLPVLFVGAISGSCHSSLLEQFLSPANSNEQLAKTVPPTSNAIAAAVTGWVLCLYVGQFPWSQPTIVEVTAKTYGLADPPLRVFDQADGKWLTEQISAIRMKSTKVLATGRVASHFVGSEDIETVGQFLQRYDDLAKLDRDLPSPILRYDIIVLDYRESFQQSAQESQRIKSEAVQHGFVVDQSAFEIEILRSPKN